ncbi:unnamed protein product [Moneuplotes crassus]|uniref:Uncharacterized protein n=1 Tax=Euplotes crassus TaxID=5936 RepID=A0AAD2D8F1_EUPCR|nr:unnamed protein product [Moneuplotes crassus]
MKLHPNQDKKVFPVTRVIFKKKPVPVSELKDGYIRIKFLEWPVRNYKSWPENTRYFVKTAILSFTLIAIIYYPGLYILSQVTKNQVLSQAPAGTDFKSVHKHRKFKRNMIKDGLQLETASDSFFEKVQERNNPSFVKRPSEKKGPKDSEIL